MEVQSVIVTIIVSLCFVWAGLRIVQSVKRIRENQNPCSGCSADCKLRAAHFKPHCPDAQVSEKERKKGAKHLQI